MVACAKGVTGRLWSSAWLALRRKAGLNASADKTLMPEILASWTFGAGRMSTTSAGTLLKEELLAGHGVDVALYGTHSGKATVLSWLSKAGVAKGVRRLLGGHAADKDWSLLEYSRDALAGPLREVAALYLRVGARKFLPDATRSGRWAEEAAESEQSSASSAEEHEEEAADAAEDSLMKREEKEKDFPPEGLLGNKATKTAHKGGGVLGVTACGHTITAEKLEHFQEWPEAPWTLCRRAKCFPAQVPRYQGTASTS